MSKICDSVTSAIRQPLLAGGIEIVEVSYQKGRSGQNDTLWIYIYHEDGVDFDVLEKANEIIDPIIDVLDPTNGAPFTLNVSSPGLDRAFQNQRDYERNFDKEVEVSLYSKVDGKKQFVGVLKNKTDELLTLDVDGKIIEIESSLISKVNQAIKFDKEN